MILFIFIVEPTFHLISQESIYLYIIYSFAENMDDARDEVAENIQATIKKLNDLFQKECLKTQNEYLDEISSLTGK